MFDLADEKRRARLAKAIKQSRSSMEIFRGTRAELIDDYNGSWYKEDTTAPKTLANLQNQTARIYVTTLASNNPRVLVHTPRAEDIPFSRRFEINLNKMIGDMKLDRTMRAIVLDAYFLLGCGVVTMRDTDTRFHGILESEEDVLLDPGEPWFNRVSFDDLILDMPAKELSKMRYCGHRYRADYEKVMDEPGFDSKVKDQLKPGGKDQDSTATTRDNASGDARDDDLKDMIWLQNVWIAENNSIATMAAYQDELPPLIQRDWTGSQAGPYKFLSLGDTPDAIIPCSPAMNLKGIHDLVNRLHFRMEEDSDAHRVVNVFPHSEKDAAERLRKSGRNDWEPLNNPESVKQVELGGVHPPDMAFNTYLIEEFDRLAGNLQAMGGLGAQAATVGQEELIHGQLSKAVSDLRMQVVGFASECILDLGRLMWEDQTLEIHSSMAVGNSGIEVEADWTPDRRDGEFEDYQFRVEEYSMVHKTPQQHLQEYFQVFRELAPMWSMFQASGASVDAEAILEEVARLTNKPEFKRFITFAVPPEMQGGDPHGATQAAHTTRENVRKNVPTGGTPEARNAATIQSLMGGGQVNGQMNAAMARAPA